jgi:hypothetical protein
MRLFWPTIDMLLEPPGVVAAPAVCLDPHWFPGLGAPPRGRTFFDTDALEGEGFVGRGVVFQQSLGQPEIAVFAFEGGSFSGDVTVRGSRPAALLFHGPTCVRARIDARGAGARREGPGRAAVAGGGGGFGGSGGGPAGASGGGPDYGIGALFEVGSGGRPGASAGGLGGGGLQIGARGSLELCGARIDADGEPGACATEGTAGGGGSGGAVVLHGSRVWLDPDSEVSVRGGDGGAASPGARPGGGGAGGWIFGACEPEGFFDPRGGRFRTRGGRPGRAAGAAAEAHRAGEGGRGVVYLAARRALGPAAVRAVPVRRTSHARA